jgi:zinc protease
MKRRSLAFSAAQRGEPASMAANRLDRALSPYAPGDVRYVPTAEESAKRLEALTLEQVTSLYEKQLGATVGEVGIVGDFDADKTLSQLGTILKDWKSTVPVRRIERSAPTKLIGSKDNILTPDKANAVFLAGLAFPLQESDPEYAALKLGNFILGGGSLSSRLGNRIRQKEGLSYGVSSTFTASTRDPAATFRANAITNPVNIDRVEKAFLEELNDFLSRGPTPEELQAAQKAYLEAEKVGRTSDAAIAGQIANNLQLGRRFADTRILEQRITALTPDAVTAAFRHWIDPQKLVIIRAGDFK